MSDVQKKAKSMLNDAFSKYYTEIYRFCLSYLIKDRTSVDDCVQETFIVLYKKLTAGEEIINIRAYLYKIAQNVTNQKLRELSKYNEHISIEEVIDLPEFTADMTDELSFKEYSRQISDALSDKEAELFRLRYIEDLPIEVIAQMMNLSFTATGTRLHRLKKKIAVILKEIM